MGTGPRCPAQRRLLRREPVARAPRKTTPAQGVHPRTLRLSCQLRGECICEICVHVFHMHMCAHVAIYWLACMYMYSCLCLCGYVEWGWREAGFFVNTTTVLGRDCMLISPSLSSSLFLSLSPSSP